MISKVKFFHYNVFPDYYFSVELFPKLSVSETINKVKKETGTADILKKYN